MPSPVIIGRILATEKAPTTIDNFAFWTNPSLILNPFDIVKVEHVNGSFSYGMIEDISHITDAASFLTNYISSDFGDVEVESPTLRVGMNYVQAKVVCNDKNIYIPLQTSVYKGYKQDKIEMRGDRAEMSDFPLYLNTVAGGLDRRDQTIGGFSFVVKIYAVPVVEIIG